ncbi:phosphoribosylformylglycinamidine cyclo-ligase [Salirhabdus euzebyi]|nr:phosphoribosylformylglycinamidine cyclo-ligase [Salirhabdus euzebyi]
MVDAYKKAGVDIEAGYESVRRMKKHIQKTNRPEVLGAIGAFGGMFDLSALNMKEPVLVSGTDGVGTKLMLAFQMNRHDTIGIDAVAMCVNDIVVQGAEPLFFLDYLALGKADPAKIEQIVKGISEGCMQAGCSLVGGETAEMPGMYAPEEYDVAGFAVGAVEKSKIISGANIEAKDALIGIRSSGLHSNGFSLVRKVLLDEGGFQLEDYYSKFDKTIGEELLTPTRIYVKTIIELLQKYEVKGMAHITGGGFYENIPRMLPNGLGAKIGLGTWNPHPIFELLQQTGQLSKEEMFSVFNMGIGMVLAVSANVADEVIDTLIALGEKAYKIGEVSAESGVELD